MKWNANYVVILASVIIAFRRRLEAFSHNSDPSASKQHNNNNDRLTAFDPGQPG